MHHRRSAYPFSTSGLTLALILAFGLVIAVAGLASSLEDRASAALSYQDIASAGPIQHVFIGNELSCQAASLGDQGYSFFPSGTAPGDCGTFLNIRDLLGDDVLFAPNFSGHAGTATLALGDYIAFSPVSQSAVGGSGTAADPYTVVTVVDAQGQGVRITQTDTYVSSTDTYRTDIALHSLRADTVSVRVYRAAECFVADSMLNFGVAVPATHSVGCATNPDNVPADRVVQWSPGTAIDHHFEGWYQDVWSRIGLHANLPDTCACSVYQQNGAAINWERTLAAGATITLSHLTTITPGQAPPLPTDTPVPPTDTPVPPTDTPTATQTSTPTNTPTSTPTSTSTATNTATSTHTPTNTATSTPTRTYTSTPTATNTPLPPTATNTPLPPIPTSTPLSGTGCADVDGDGVVTLSDVAEIGLHLGHKRFDAKYDLNGDGKVTGADVLIATRQVGLRCAR